MDQHCKLGLWSLPVLHAANLTKYNWWFDEGPKGLKLNHDYMSEMNKCNTAQLEALLPRTCYIALFPAGTWTPQEWVYVKLKQGYNMSRLFIGWRIMCIDSIFRTIELLTCCNYAYFKEIPVLHLLISLILTLGPLGLCQIIDWEDKLYVPCCLPSESVCHFKIADCRGSKS